MIRKRLMTEINLAAFKFHENSHCIQYSEDLKSILTSSLEQKFGGAFTSHRAAIIIQQSYRQYRLRKKLNSSTNCDTKTVRLRNNSMPENLHNFEQQNDHCESSNENLNYSFQNNFTLGNLKLSKIKDSLCHLLPELQNSSMLQSSHSESSNAEIEIQMADNILYEGYQVKVGDVLSTKCDEDLEKFQNDSNKTDSTEESDTSSVEQMPSALQASTSLEKLPPPMPVISTNLLATRTEKLKAKIKLFTFDNCPSEIEETKIEPKTSTAKIPPVSRASLAYIQSGRSPRDSGVSSHSSNTDLLTFDYSDMNRVHTNNCLYNQRPLSVVSSGCVKPTSIIQSSSQKEKNTIPEIEKTVENYIPPIFEDNDSLFDNSLPHIPSVMTSSKDSGVDADSVTAMCNQSNYLQRISFQDKPIYWRLLHRHNCLMGCISQNSNCSSSQKAEISKKTETSSLWLKHNNDLAEAKGSFETTNLQTIDMNTKEFVNRVLYRVAVNLFNRNSSVGLKFMDDHKIFNVRCPIEIASFLRNREVNLQVVADFISSQNSIFHLNVLKCYLKNLPLQNLNFLEAFDTFIRTFKIPDDSTRVDYLILQFCQYFVRHFQKSPAIDTGSLMGLGRIIILLRSNVDRSKSLSLTNSILSFGDFIKHIQNCFKDQHIPYSMEMLQKVYIGITRSSPDSKDLANKLLSKIDNIKEPKAKTSTPSPSKFTKPAFFSGHFLQTYRRLTYCCDVQQSDSLNKKLKKYEHLRSLFIFNDSFIIAKRSNRISSKPSKYFRTDSKFQCRSIINLLNYRVEKVAGSVNAHQISIKCIDESAIKTGLNNTLIYFICDSESSCDKLLSKVILSQLECQCVEQLRLHQWDCNHSTKECLCLSVIHAASRILFQNNKNIFQSPC